MAKPSRATREKRTREKALQEKRREKLDRRLLRKMEKDNNPRPSPGEDPDLAGIVPGPQRSPWTDA
jgi:hypothetical protein